MPPGLKLKRELEGHVMGTGACLLHEAVLQRSKHPQAGAFALIDKLYSPIVQHLSRENARSQEYSTGK